MKLKQIVAVALSVLAMTVNANAKEAIISSKELSKTQAYNWYCKNNDMHLPPELPSEFSFINEAEAYYVDKNAQDNDKVIYLTFDAGYENGNIEKILDVLKEHNANGAFFVLSNLVMRNTQLVKRMVEEGHLVCNHTSTHKDMTRMKSMGEFKEELDKLNSVMQEYCGCQTAPFYRPPEGRFSIENLEFAKNCGYKTVFWSYAYADWDNNKQMSDQKAMSKLLDHVHNGEVLLLHPTSSTNASILGDFLTELEKQGYRFGTLYELTNSQ